MTDEIKDKETTMNERAEALLRVSLKDPDHLKRWLVESGRAWLVFNAAELVDSLPFPSGVDIFMQVIACYRDHRVVQPTGRYETQTEPTLGNKVQVAVMKTDNLEIEELDRCIRFLIKQASEKDPNWKLSNPAM